MTDGTPTVRTAPCRATPSHDPPRHATTHHATPRRAAATGPNSRAAWRTCRCRTHTRNALRTLISTHGTGGMARHDGHWCTHAAPQRTMPRHCMLHRATPCHAAPRHATPHRVATAGPNLRAACRTCRCRACACEHSHTQHAMARHATPWPATAHHASPCTRNTVCTVCTHSGTRTACTRERTHMRTCERIHACTNGAHARTNPRKC